jgi:2-alkyl-3-oxoalkanoate reductase
MVDVRVFVAGATGVVGHRLIPLLIAQGHSVTAAARSPGNRVELTRAGAKPVSADLFSPAALHAAVRGHDAVVNVATHIPSPPWRVVLRSAWAENDRVRKEGSANLVDAAIAGGASRFIQESFAPVYPDSGDKWIDETTPLAPTSYNRSVLDAERSAKRFTDSGRAGVVLRFGAFYGPDAGHLADMIRMVRKGRAPLPGDPGAYISSCSHDDAATAVAAALVAAPGVYNVVDDQPLTHREYFDSLAAALGVGPPRLPPRWVTPLFGSIGKLLARSLRISNLRFRSSSPWEPRYPSVRDGWPSALAGVDGRTSVA